MLNKEERIAALIDGSNIYGASRHLGLDLDYSRLNYWLSQRGKLIRAYYFTALKEEEEYKSIKPLVDWLDYNGYKIVSKIATTFTDSEGRSRTKGNMDIELCIHGLRIAEHVDRIYLFSGDGDFTCLVEEMQERHGCSVTVVSHRGHMPNFRGNLESFVSDRLRRVCDQYIDLLDIRDVIVNKEKENGRLRRP